MRLSKEMCDDSFEWAHEKKNVNQVYVQLYKIYLYSSDVLY